MIESIIEWSIRNRFLVILASLCVGAAGLRALLTMPVDAIPDLSENQVIVFTDWMGRGPQEIEDQVTYPLSVNLQGLAGVKVVRSSSEFNFSMINIIFDDATDYYFARQRVQEKLAIATTFLPPGVTPYMGPDATALGQIFWYTVEGDGRDLGELRAIQDWYVRYQLNSVPGVAEVASVGGAPREYQIDLDPDALRAYGISLGEVDSAVARSNSAVGGRVIHKGNAEYLIRSIGWIKNLDDLRNTVVAQRNGTPIFLKTLATVQLGPQFRRSVLEKDGREVVGGVVLMRHGENPLEITRRIKEKVATLQAGLPVGVRIVPFYDRTPLIKGALATVSDTVKEELIICTVAIVLVMGHLGGAFVVSITLPLAILFSFLMMKLCGIPSNIMSLAGIAISVGILEDQAVVMTENAAHHLTRAFGNRPIRGDVLDIIIPACRTVGRPIFFSVLITILSFLPVFALSGMEGKMFHPLAYTKTFALIGVAVLAITLVPALIPIFLKGRIKSEDESWLVRTMIAIFRPLLSWLMDRPTLVCWLFACIIGCGYLASTRLGREFMPPLDEGTIMDMPTSVPRMSLTQAAEDLKTRNAVLRGFPEVLSVVGKAGRAETPTDPAPLDMVETMVNLRDRDAWPRRKLEFKDVSRQTRAALAAMETNGLVRPLASGDDRDALVNDAAMAVASRVDESLRALALKRLADAPEDRDQARLKAINWELFDHAVTVATAFALDELSARSGKCANATATAPASNVPANLAKLKPGLEAPFSARLLLWKKTKGDLIQEMDSALQVPGWGNIWTQPIINRVDMLATGVRTQIGVKVFGDDLGKIQQLGQQIAAVLRTVRGAVDVFPDQVVGKGYVEIQVDREKAARYGIQVGDIQDVVEVALGGKPLTMTVEGRQRYPVRVRYARDFRTDEEALKRILVAARGSTAAWPAPGTSMAMTAGGAGATSRSEAPPLQVPLAEVADVRVVEGPSMIKSENGLLRSYVQLNVRDRDVVGFVEEARRLVSEKVKLPSGMYLEWSGQFEHQVRARRTLQWVFPAVLALIVLILYLTYKSWIDAALMLTSVVGALAGGAIFQWIFGYNFSVAVWVGYIACFGMATETGIVMLVYLREAIAERGGLEAIGSIDELREAILDGAIHRLRPKLLTEGTTIISIAPMLWADGVGSEVIRPMAAPVLGGLLIADEVIDIFLPVLYFAAQKWRWRKLHRVGLFAGPKRRRPSVDRATASADCPA